MKMRVNSTTLAPLLDVARTDPDPGVRHAALDAATRLPLSEVAWRALAATLTAAVQVPGRDALERTELLALAARVPLISVRRKLRSIAADADDPAAAALRPALAKVGDESQIDRLLADAAAGRQEAFESLAAMPLESAGLSLARLPAQPPRNEPEARLWAALAAARLGDYRWLDPFLEGNEPEPPVFFGPPALPYARIAAMRPLPEALQAHLVAHLARLDGRGGTARERMARITIWAATGLADSDGEPSGARDERATASPSPQHVKDAVEAARPFLDEATLRHFDTDGSWPRADVGPQVMRILGDAQASAAALPPSTPANLIVGNPIVRLLGALPAAGEWPTRDLLLAQLGATRPALDDEQSAWVIARAAPSRWIGPLASLLTPPLRPAAERLRILEIARAAAEHAAGHGPSPLRGSGGPGPSAAGGRHELIDDEGLDDGASFMKWPWDPRPGVDPDQAIGDELAIRTPGRKAVGSESAAPLQPRSMPRPAAPLPTGGADATAATDGPGRGLPALVPQPPPTHPAGHAAVFCPPVVGRGTVFLLQVLLHQSEQAAEAREQALEADASAERRGVLALPPDLPNGTRLDLHLEAPALRVDEPDAALVWTGTTTAAQFEVTVPAEAPVGNTVGRVRLSVAGVPIGTLRFQVGIASKAAHQPRNLPAEARHYRRAFVSYSSQDRAEVLRRVQAFRIAGLSVFQDILDLEPGQRWDRELYREIDRSDVLLLFWSSAAAASPWVAKEIQYALSLKQGREDQPPDIAPVPIEGPPIPPPPESLRHLHFNDALLAHIAAASDSAPG